MYGYNDYMGPYGMNNFNNAPRMQTMQPMPPTVQENNGMDIAYVQNMNQIQKRKGGSARIYDGNLGRETREIY